MSRTSGSDTLYCSFCGKNQHEVRKLIAGPGPFICDECVDLCHEIVHEKDGTALAAVRRTARRAEIVLDIRQRLDDVDRMLGTVRGLVADIAHEDPPADDGERSEVIGFGGTDDPDPEPPKT